jgi:oligosaccharide repeat unit polymerase
MGMVDFLAFVILSALCYLALRFSRSVYGDYFAPLGIFLSVNLASLAFYHLRLIPMVSLSFQAYALIVVAFFSFSTGTLLATPSVALKGQPLRKRASSSHFWNSKGLSLFYYFSACLALAGWVFFVIQIVPPGWVQNLWMLQGDYEFPYHLGYTLVAGIAVPPSFVLLRAARGKTTFPMAFFLITTVLALAIVGIKSYLIIAVATSLIVWAMIHPGWLKWKHLAMLALCLVGFMALYDHFIDVFVPRHFPGSRFPAMISFLERPYIYLVGPWAAMSVVMAAPPPQTHWGQVTLFPLWKILGPGGIGVMERVPQYLPFVDIGPSMCNVYSLIGEVYWDWGWLGVILICFSLGFISTRLYIKTKTSRNWIMCLSASFFSYGLFISFFAYYYRETLIFLLIYPPIMGPVIRKASSFFKVSRVRTASIIRI